ncbi:hypothetical protein COLO4_06382 [Corchorus olitorius]|uniref:Uncharacterized protein n=1 Tax=Corchorus olitorius TaxID=93759 RepID=A0A1R3KN49_9ROSI|nr:hypothetical protein COLO4_06382 [Corchorus olitorius]
MGKSSNGGANNRQNNGDSTPTTSSASTFKAKQLLACFLCNRPHKVKECPHRGVLSALQASKQQILDVHQVEEETESELARVGSLRFLTSLHSKLNLLLMQWTA